MEPARLKPETLRLLVGRRRLLSGAQVRFPAFSSACFGPRRLRYNNFERALHFGAQGCPESRPAQPYNIDRSDTVFADRDRKRRDILANSGNSLKQ
jgi:hypothetical protein